MKKRNMKKKKRNAINIIHVMNGGIIGIKNVIVRNMITIVMRKISVKKKRINVKKRNVKKKRRNAINTIHAMTLAISGGIIGIKNAVIKNIILTMNMMKNRNSFKY